MQIDTLILTKGANVTCFTKEEVTTISFYGELPVHDVIYWIGKLKLINNDNNRKE